MKKPAIFLAMILYLTGVAAQEAQLLGDLAREEKKRREAVSGGITIIENIPSAAPVRRAPAAPDMEALTDEEYRQLAEVVDEINKILPMMLNSEMRLDEFSALPNKTVRSVHTYVNYSIEDLNLEGVEEFKNQILQEFNADEALERVVLNNIKTISDSELNL